jgi:hypothetical protein
MYARRLKNVPAAIGSVFWVLGVFCLPHQDEEAHGSGAFTLPAIAPGNAAKKKRKEAAPVFLYVINKPRAGLFDRDVCHTAALFSQYESKTLSTHESARALLVFLKHSSSYSLGIVLKTMLGWIA